MQMMKILAIAVAGTLALTGCQSNIKRKPSNVAVAPLATDYAPNYDGGDLVNNADAVTTAAQNLQGVVHFAFDSSALDSTAQGILMQHVGFLQQNPSAKVLVAGHTDERGSREYNMALGERRAAAVREFLSANGVDNASIEIMSYGEERPVATGASEDAYAQNRRAELSY